MGREAGTEKAIHYAAGFTAAGFNDFWNHMEQCASAKNSPLSQRN